VGLNQIASSKSMAPPEMNSTEGCREVLNDAATRVERYLATISNRRFVVPHETIQYLAALGGPLRSGERNQNGFSSCLTLCVEL
jgi:hypothetical protein